MLCPPAATETDLNQLKRYLSELNSDEVISPVPAWVTNGRAALWQEKDFIRNRNLERLQGWQPPPQPVSDEFRLVRSWPCYMESLRPFPKGSDKLLDLANDV
jgi:hypothetical protein